jgi:hypothetical protein
MRVLHAAFHLKLEIQVAKALQGKTIDRITMSDDEFNDEKDLAFILDTDFINQIGYYHVAKLKLNVHFGHWNEAVKWANNVYPIYAGIAHQIAEIEFEIFTTIALLYASSEILDDENLKAEYFEKINAGLDKVNSWADICEYNFRHKVLLLKAIKEGLFGEYEKSIDLFNQAKSQVNTTCFLNDKAFIIEHLCRIQSKAKQTIDVNDAIEAYDAFGAFEKSKYMKELFSS